MRNTLALVAAVLVPTSSAVAGELILLTAAQQYNGDVRAFNGGGGGGVQDAFSLTAPNAFASWSPAVEDISVMSSAGGFARVHSSYQSIVEPGRLSFRNETFEARVSYPHPQVATGSFYYDNLFDIGFRLDAATEVTFSASITREHPSGWSSGMPCSVVFQRVGGPTYVSVSYAGGVPPFPYVDAHPETTMVLPAGDYRVTARNRNGSLDGAHIAAIYRDVVAFDLALVNPPPSCPGDVNFDNQVNNADLTVMLGNFGREVTPGMWGDFNEDGVVNTSDLSILLANFGTVCN